MRCIGYKSGILGIFLGIHVLQDSKSNKGSTINDLGGGRRNFSTRNFFLPGTASENFFFLRRLPKKNFFFEEASPKNFFPIDVHQKFFFPYIRTCRMNGEWG